MAERLSAPENDVYLYFINKHCQVKGRQFWFAPDQAEVLEKEIAKEQYPKDENRRAMAVGMNLFPNDASLSLFKIIHKTAPPG